MLSLGTLNRIRDFEAAMSDTKRCGNCRSAFSGDSCPYCGSGMSVDLSGEKQSLPEGDDGGSIVFWVINHNGGVLRVFHGDSSPWPREK